MKSEFLISGIETGKLNAMVKNVMTQTGITEPEEAVRMMNSGELRISVIKPKWTDKDGIIRFSLTADGTTGEQWIARLESKGFCVADYAKSVLRSKSFKPTSDTYEIAVLKGEIFSDNERITKNIREEAKNRKLATPNAEIACLIREKFSDKELEAIGLHRIIAMHEPIGNSIGSLGLLGVDRCNVGSWLDTGYGSPVAGWSCVVGFAFVSQISGS